MGCMGRHAKHLRGAHLDFAQRAARIQRVGKDVANLLDGDLWRDFGSGVHLDVLRVFNEIGRRTHHTQMGAHTQRNPMHASS